MIYSDFMNDFWYMSLNKPFLSPPDWIFMPVWVFLYILMAISFVLFIKTGNLKEKLFPITVFVGQLALNFSWSPVFFGLENIGLALIIILVLLFLIGLTIFLFFRYSKIASLLLLPYFLWVMFATYLNMGYFILN